MLFIKQMRSLRGKKQQEIADHLNMQRASYANIENGKRDPDTSTLLAIADYLEVSLDDLFGRRVSECKIDLEYTADEKDILTAYRNFNQAGKDYLKQTIATMEASDIYKKRNTIPNVEAE